MNRRTTEECFWLKVDRRAVDECWLWIGAVQSSGYGSFQGQLAHRFAHELLVGPIPDGHQVDHLCRVRLCVNPDHLEAVTAEENVRRTAHCSSVEGPGRVESLRARLKCDERARQAKNFDEADDIGTVFESWREWMVS